MDGISEIDSLVNSTYGMMLVTKQGENNLDSMLSRAHKVAATINAMYKYEKVLQDMQDLTVNGNRRKLILNDLQRENKQIMALQDENRQLRETTEEYLATIRDILESHSELETTIIMQQQNKEIDNIDNIIYEMANTNVETRLKEKALKMEMMMDELEKFRKEQKMELQLAAQKNLNYRELFKMACFSSPAAGNVLKSAMKLINENEKKSEDVVENSEDPVDVPEVEEEEDENQENELNKTIIRKS